MSIYGSIQPETLCAIPERDYHDGKVEEDHPTAMVDVAVALSWHDCIRLSVVRRDDDNYVLITSDEATTLVETLTRAIQAVRGE